MKKIADRTVELDKGHVDIYTENGVTLYAYQTRDLIDNEMFILAKNGRGLVIELPCFYDNIRELIRLPRTGAHHGRRQAGRLPRGGRILPARGPGLRDGFVCGATTPQGGGAGLVANFKAAFGSTFDAELCAADHLLEEGETGIAGIRLVVRPNAEAYDLEIPEINCVYTHMMGHDCHSIVAGCPHADGIISQLNYYIRHGFSLCPDRTLHPGRSEGREDQGRLSDGPEGDRADMRERSGDEGEGAGEVRGLQRS